MRRPQAVLVRLPRCWRAAPSGPDYVRPTRGLAAGLAHRVRAGRRPGQHALVAAVRRPGAEPADRRGAARQPRPADRRGARRPVHRPADDHALAVLSADRLRRRRQPQPQQPRRRAAAGRRRRPVLHAVPGRAVGAVADRPVRPRAPAERGGAGPALRQRAGPPRRGAVAGHQRGGQLHRRCAGSTGSSRSRAPPPTTWPTRSASSSCASRAAWSRRWRWSRSSRSTSRRWPRFPRSSSRSPRRRT